MTAKKKRETETRNSGSGSGVRFTCAAKQDDAKEKRNNERDDRNLPDDMKPGLVYHGFEERARGSGKCRPRITSNSSATRLMIVNARAAPRPIHWGFPEEKPQTQRPQCTSARRPGKQNHINHLIQVVERLRYLAAVQSDGCTRRIKMRMKIR